VALIGNTHQIDLMRNDATGWRGLLDGLVHVLGELEYDVTISQVKEKYGGLRIYATNDPNASEQHVRAVTSWIEAAEEASFLLCYVCGAGVTHVGSGSWTRFFCAEHDTPDVFANRSASRQTPPAAADQYHEIER